MKIKEKTEKTGKTGKNEKTKKKTIIYGAGCQGRAVLDIIGEMADVEVVGFIDDNLENRGKEYYGKKILGNADDLKKLVEKKEVSHGIIGIGGFSRQRKEKFILMKSMGIKMLNAIHEFVIISKNVKFIGEGVFIGAGAIIGPDSEIGNNTIINCSVCLPIANKIEDHVNITPGAIFAAGTVIKEESYIGMGANIKQYITIGKRAIIGAGAVVLDNVEEEMVVYGIPAKPVKKRED